MAGLTNPYKRDVDGGVESWDPSVGRWRFTAAATPPSMPILPAPAAEQLSDSGVEIGDAELLEVEDRATIGGGDPTVIRFLGASGVPGTQVTYAKAFMDAAVWACMDVIASALSSSDWNVYGGIRGADKKEALFDDQAQFILNTRANPEMTSQSAKRAIALCAMAGNGYAEIEWDRAGRFAALWPIDFQRVTPTRNEYGQYVYRCQNGLSGASIDMDPADIFHVRGPSFTGGAGDDAIGRAVRSIAQSIAVAEFSQSYFQNGTNLGGIVTMKGKPLGPDEFADFKKKWNSRYSGPRRGNATAFLEGNTTYTPLDSNAQKADLTNWKQSVIEEIARWWHVPPHKIGHLLRATNNNIEHQGLEFVKDTLRPWAVEIQQEADYKFFSPRGARRFLELDMDWAAQGDYGSRATAFQTLLNTGVLTINDILRKLGENTIGPDGDKRLVQGAMIPLKDAGKMVEQKQLAGAEPPQRTGGTTEPKPPGGEPKATMQAWLASIYARAQRRLENRRTAGAPKPRADAEEYLDAELAELEALLEEPRHAMVAKVGGRNALDGTPAADAARTALTLMEQP